MDKRITGLVILFFFLFTLANGEAGWVKLSSVSKKSTSDCADAYPDADTQEDERSSEEEDTSKGRELDDREMDEYESALDIFFLLPHSSLLNSQYSFQHLLFKEHFLEANVPPPRS